MLAADEVFALSTVKEVAAVIAIGDAVFTPGPVTARLAEAFTALVAAETTSG